jgi:predicted DNA-binding transcriptional regulator AlpA
LSKTSATAITAATETGLPANIDQVFDAHGAAKHTGLSKSTLDKLRIFGGGPVFVKYTRRVAYRKSDLDAWMDGKRVTSTSQYAA